MLEEASYCDEILSLPIFHLTREAGILPLSHIKSNTVCLIPITPASNSMLHMPQEEQIDLLHCSWEVNFL
jgi:hypothetical protein